MENKKAKFELKTVSATLILIVGMTTLSGADDALAVEKGKIQEPQFGFIAEKIPDATNIAKQNEKMSTRQSEKEKEMYIVEGTESNYKVTIGKEQNTDSSYDYDVQVSSSNNRLSENNGK